jgi:hypothetical protein
VVILIGFLEFPVNSLPKSRSLFPSEVVSFSFCWYIFICFETLRFDRIVAASCLEIEVLLGEGTKLKSTVDKVRLLKYRFRYILAQCRFHSLPLPFSFQLLFSFPSSYLSS